MSLTRKRYYTGRPGTTIGQLVAPLTTKGQLKQLWIANNTASAATLTLYAVPPGGSPGPDNILLPTTSFPANEPIPISVALFDLEVGASIHGLQGTAGALTLHIHGLEG